MLKDVSGRSIGPSSINKGLLVSTIAGALGMVFVVSTGGAFLTGFARKLGASQFQIGVINAFVPMAAVSQLLSSYMIERRGWRRKPVLCISLSIMRLLWVPILLIPFLLGYSDTGNPSRSVVAVAVNISLIIMALSSLLSGFGSLAWQAWMADLIPPERRGRFFGTRTTIVNAVNVAFGLLMGHYLDTNDSFVAFAVIFGVGVFFGIADLVIHAFVPEPMPVVSPTTHPFCLMCLNPFKDRNFRGLIWFTLTWNFAVWLILPFLPVFQIETLKLSYVAISWIGNVFLISMMIASPFAGKLVDRVGGLKVYVVSFIIMVTMPLFWIAMTRTNAIPVSIVMNIISGIFNATINVATTQLLFANSPVEERSIYIAVFSAIGGISGTVGPLVGGWIGDIVANGSIHIGALSLQGLKVVFALSFVLRLSCLPFLRIVKEVRHEKNPLPSK